MSILETVKTPQDVKRLSVAELQQLAKEVRELIITTVNANGGHLASNLGAVELTIALHRIFNSPEDKLIFDVSHQSYTHKILTGRADGFENIRTSQGYSGYFEPIESPHDALAIGHAGCAPSLALGMATAARLMSSPGYFVAVIGDGGMTSGLAYEGLSNIIEQNPRNLMVILNDNGMAISSNVGWLAKWRGRWLPNLRGRLELDTDFQEFEQVTESLAPKVPFGEVLLDLGRGMKSAIQKSLVPNIGHIWDEMGFNYIGPVDGHNIGELLETITQAREKSDKVPFIHVLTNKGQGWALAAENPTKYHQPGPPSTGEKKPTYSQVFASTLLRIMAQNPKVVAISAAMLEGTGLARVKEYYPNRVFDVGICEEHAVSMAAGMARAGLRPIVCIYSTFLQRSFDQIMHDVCMNELPVIFALDRAGIVGQDGKTHHGLYDLAFMRIAPGMVVTVPKDENEMASLLGTALSWQKPWSIRFPRGEARGVPVEDRDTMVLLGSSERLLKGEKICLLGVGEAAWAAMEAYELLKAEGHTPEVVNMRFLKPVDQQLVKRLGEYHAFEQPYFTDVWVIEEGTSVGGAAAALLEALSSAGIYHLAVHSISVGDEFPDHGEIPELRERYGLDAAGIARRVLEDMRGGA